MTATKSARPDRRCGLCGRSAPARGRRELDGVRLGTCSRCVSKPIGPCTTCGRTGALYGTRQRLPLACGFCWNAHVGTCTACSSERALIPTGDGPASVCEACYRPRARRCGSCLKTGGRIKVIARNGEPDLCENCWRGPRTTCVLCRRERRCPTGTKPGTAACAACVPRRPPALGACGRTDMPFAVTSGTVICWPCHRARSSADNGAPAAPAARGPATRRAGDLKRPAGWRRDYGCHDCGTTYPRYTYGRCDRCALAAVFDHLTPYPDARRTLAPLRQALLDGPRPATSLKWLRTNPPLLIGMGCGAVPIDHTALDDLPRTRATETLRGRLIATGCLPQRNTCAADFQTWLAAYLADSEPAAHRLVLHEYGTWRILPRIHRPRDSRPQTYSTLQYAKTRIRTAQQFLTWLDDYDMMLTRATQSDVDDFVTQHTHLAGTLEPFLRWTTKTRRSRKLACRRPPADQPGAAITPEERWHLLRRLLHDESLDLSDRVMGAIILSYATPLTKVLLIRIDQVTISTGDSTNEPEVHLQLGPAALCLPPLLDQLIARQLLRSRNATAIVTNPWLFPGTRAGRPLSTARAAVRLRRLGLYPGLGRSRALLHLAARIGARLLAQALGITASTAVRWSDLAGRTFSGYVARVVESQTVGPA